MSCGESSGPHGIGSAARMRPCAATRRLCTTATAGTASSSPRRHHHQHPAKVRDDVDADDLRPAHTAGTGAPAPDGHALAVDRHVTRARTDVFADLEAQTHRRFIKTHTAARRDTQRSAVTYICVGRDPRDAGLSMDHHIGNTDIGAFLSQRERAAAIDGNRARPIAATAARAPTASGTASGSGPTTRRRRRRSGRRCGAL